MPNVTVTAVDTATAMDEICAKLGPDAMIVSTTKQQGKIIMKATTETSVKAPEPELSSTKGFSEMFSKQMIGKDPINLGTKNTVLNNIPDQNHDLTVLRRDIATIQDMLTGMVLTDLDGINPSLAPSTRIELQRAGFSSQILHSLQTHYAGYSYGEGCERFLKALATQLVHPTSATTMQKRLIFVVGATGTGRTTIVAKIAAMLREQNPNKEIVLASLSDQDGAANHQLQSFGRLLNLPGAMLSLSTQVEDFNKMTDYDFMVIDVHSDNTDAIFKIQEIQSQLGDSEVGVILTLPGSTSSKMVKSTISRFEAIKPIIAITKLDECETGPSEFSAMAETGAKIGMLSGTKSVIDAAVFASENILLQYLMENFSNHGSWAPTQTGSE